MLASFSWRNWSVDGFAFTYVFYLFPVFPERSVKFVFLFFLFFPVSFLLLAPKKFCIAYSWLIPFPRQNPEFGILRKIETGFSNLSTLLGEVERLGAEFWTSTLPANGGDANTSKDNTDKSLEKSQVGHGWRTGCFCSDDGISKKGPEKFREHLLSSLQICTDSLIQLSNPPHL